MFKIETLLWLPKKQKTFFLWYELIGSVQKASSKGEVECSMLYTLSTQVAPLAQGLDTHSSSSISQFGPVNPA